jgi:hypothetical protein
MIIAFANTFENKKQVSQMMNVIAFDKEAKDKRA